MTNEKMIEMLTARKMCLTSKTYVDKRCDEDCDSCKYNYLMGNMGEQIELCNELIIILATFCSIEKNLINKGSNPFDKYVNKQMKEGE